MLVRILARSTWTKAALAVLSDGGWHARDDVLRAGARVVPPGVAFRHGEKERQRLRKTGPGPRERGDDETAASSGAWDLVRENITSLIASGKLERAVVDGVDCLRIARVQEQAS